VIPGRMPQLHAQEWIAAVVESPAFAAEDGESFRPAILVWFEPETGAVIDIHVTRPGLADAPALFTRATEQPKEGPPRRPARVRVADPVLADALRGRIGEVEVVEGDIAEAREALQSLAEFMSRMESEPEIEPAAWARMFRAAAALYRARPWDTIPADEWIGVECEQLGISRGALTVVGQQGESHGFLLCRTVEDAVAWLTAGERRQRGEPAAFPSQFFMFGYDDRRELDPVDVEEVERHGWEIAGPAAYPSLTVLDQDTEGRLPTADELAGVTAVVESLCEMLDDEPHLADAWNGEPVDWEGGAAGARVRLVAPLELPPAPTHPEDASIEILGEDGQVDEVRLDRYRSALMTRLAAREEITEEVLAAAEMLVEFAAQYHGVTFGKITADQLQALLLETIPAQLAVESDEAGRIVAAARELMRFAGEELGSAAAPACLALLDDAFEQRLARELANAANFGTGKQLVMAGIAAGFDMSTEEGVADFVQTFASSQRPQRRAAKPKAKTNAKAKAKPAAKAKPKAKPAAKAKAKAKPTAKAKPKAKPTAKAKPRKPPGRKR